MVIVYFSLVMVWWWLCGGDWVTSVIHLSYINHSIITSLFLKNILFFIITFYVNSAPHTFNSLHFIIHYPTRQPRANAGVHQSNLPSPSRHICHHYSPLQSGEDDVDAINNNNDSGNNNYSCEHSEYLVVVGVVAMMLVLILIINITTIIQIMVLPLLLLSF